jgi:hypothetical protein
MGSQIFARGILQCHGDDAGTTTRLACGRFVACVIGHLNCGGAQIIVHCGHGLDTTEDALCAADFRVTLPIQQ